MLRKFLLYIFTLSLLFANESSIVQEKVLKEQFYSEVLKEFKHDFSIWGVEFDKETLLIRFAKSNILYKKGKSDMQRSFELILKDFYPRYLALLLKNKDYIYEVQIKGHSSSQDSVDKSKSKDENFDKNIILSQERSTLVLEYVKNLSDDVIIQNIDWINDIFTALGLSSTEIILNKNNKEDKALSRRIEFLPIFDDSKFLNKNISGDLETVQKDTYVATKEEIKAAREEELKLISALINQNTGKTQIVEVDSKSKKLKYYVEKLLVENPTLNEQYELLKSIQQDIKIAQAAFKPTIKLNYNYTRYSKSDPDNKSSTKEKDITVKYNLFNGFKDEKEVNIKKYNYLSLKYKKDQTQTDLIYKLVEAYITIQKADELGKLARENKKDYIQWLEKEKIKFQNGIITLKDYAKVQARAIKREINFEEEIKRYVDSITTIRRYIDFDDKDLANLERLNHNSKYFENNPLAFEDSKKMSPYISEAEQNIILYKEKLQQSKVHFYPIIDLIGKKRINDDYYETASSDVTTKETTLGVEATIDLYSGGKDEANYEKKLFEYRQKLRKRDEVYRDVKFEIQTSFNKYEMVIVKNDWSEELIGKRSEELVGANYEYKFAKIDANAVLDSVDNLYDAKKQFIENKYEIILTKYKLMSDIGTIRKEVLGG